MGILCKARSPLNGTHNNNPRVVKPRVYTHCLISNQYVDPLLFPPQQMLVVYPPSDVEYYDEPSMFEAPANYMPKVSATRPTPYLPDYSQALKWERLRHANFKLNQMKKIDDSLVRTLDVFRLLIAVGKKLVNLLDLTLLCY